MRTLTLNTGSNSLKFEVVDVSSPGSSTGQTWGRSLISGAFDDIGKAGSVFRLFQGKRVTHEEPVTVQSHEAAAARLFDWFAHGAAAQFGVESLAAIERVAHRVVHGADEFSAAVAISDAVVAQIAGLDELAPLHNEHARKVIDAARARFAESVPMFAIFDTAFHRTMPDEAALYALPLAFAKNHRIRRYGFHGISHQYLAMRYAQLTGKPLDTLKLITLHLEGGSSVAAIRSGASIDTSMGFTPLEGLMMGTRCGDLDPAILPYLLRKEGWSPDRLEHFLNKECGLLGVSGRSADTRELLEHVADSAVDLALALFCYRARKYIGAYLAALGGADAIIFGGGIGENTPLVRQRICADLGWCGAVIDANRNAQVIDREAPISVPKARLPLWVIPTQEGLMMARLCSRL